MMVGISPCLTVLVDVVIGRALRLSFLRPGSSGDGRPSFILPRSMTHTDQDTIPSLLSRCGQLRLHGQPSHGHACHETPSRFVRRSWPSLRVLVCRGSVSLTVPLHSVRMAHNLITNYGLLDHMDVLVRLFSLAILSLVSAPTVRRPLTSLLPTSHALLSNRHTHS